MDNKLIAAEVNLAYADGRAISYREIIKRLESPLYNRADLLADLKGYHEKWEAYRKSFWEEYRTLSKDSKDSKDSMSSGIEEV